MEIGYTALKRLKHNGERYEKGAFIDGQELDEQSAKRLLFLNVIQKSFREEGNDEVVDENSGLNPSINVKETTEEILDLNFKLDELKEGAEELNIDFPGNIAKKKLIDLIVEQGKQDYFLEQLED